MALGPRETAALLTVLGRRHALENAAAEFDSVFGSADVLNACHALVLLLQARRRNIT
jgi:hypothetical protein